MAKNDDRDIIIFNAKEVVKRKKRLLDELGDIDDSVSSLPSTIMTKHKKEKESKKEMKRALKEEKKAEEYPDDDGWMTTLTTFTAPITKKKTRGLFEGIGVKKKKKKKQKPGETVNYKKEFEPELALLRNLQYEQDKFVVSLQRKYDQMENTKSTARGVGKFTTDLIQSITQARSLSRQLTTDIISTKKTIADLDIKERKEFGTGLNQTNDSAAYASNFLKQMMGMDRVNQGGSETSYTIDDLSDDTSEMFDSISESLGESMRSQVAQKYLEFENEHPVTKVLYHKDKEGTSDLDELYDFVTYTEDGREIPDYPHQKKTRLTINESTGVCKDDYGVEYPIIFD